MKKKYEESNIQAIAEAIREKTGTDNTYDTSEMASGVGEVFEAGKKAEYDAFWDRIQQNGNRDFYEYGFYYWDSEYIRPKHKVVTSNRSRNLCVFAYNRALKKIEKEYFDLSNYIPSNDSVNGNYYLFYSCEALEEIEDIGIQAGGYYYAFNSCPKLKRIEVMRCREDGIYTVPFTACYDLTDITIEGVIGTNFPIPFSPLSPASLKSIIKHLKNYSGTDKEFAYTVTFKSSAFNELMSAGFDDDDYEWFENTFGYSKEYAIENSLSWHDMCSGLCWNIVLA